MYHMFWKSFLDVEKYMFLFKFFSSLHQQTTLIFFASLVLFKVLHFFKKKKSYMYVIHFFDVSPKAAFCCSLDFFFFFYITFFAQFRDIYSSAFLIFICASCILLHELIHETKKDWFLCNLTCTFYEFIYFLFL